MPNSALRSLLQIARFVDDQRRLWVTKMLDNVVTDVVAHRVLVPLRPRQQVLHPIRGGVASMLGDRPAVLARQVGQQPAHERPGPPAQVHPAKPASDPTQQLVEQLLPAGRVYLYAVACGHRLICCRHNTGSSTVAALVCPPGRALLALSPSQVTIYGWSTNCGRSGFAAPPQQPTDQSELPGDCEHGKQQQEEVLVVPVVG